MFSEKSIHPRLCLWGCGALTLLFLVGSMTACSSRAPEPDKFYSSEEGIAGSAEEAVASLSPEEFSKPAATPGTVISIPDPPYSQADREVVLRYVENGENDSANLDQALKLVQRAEQLSPEKRKMEDYLILAAHYWMKGDMKQVVQHANQGIMAKSDSQRVRAHMFIYLGYTYEDKSPTMARSYFRQAAQIDPDFYKGNYELGHSFFVKKEYSKAKAPLKEALDLNPESADVYGMLGQMFYKLDQYEEAAVSLEKALAMSPQTHWLYLKLGDTYFYGLKKRKEGGSYYQQAVSKSGSDPDAHFALALYYRYKDEYTKAEEHLEKAITLDHKNPKYNRELEDMRSERKEMAAGVQKYKQAIAQKPADPGPVSKLGRYYLRWGKYEKAEEQYVKAVQLASKAAEAPAAKPDPEASEAKQDSEAPAEPPVKEPSRVPEHASNLGWFYFNDKKYAQAEKAFKTALKVDPKYIEAQFGMGRTYESMKQYDLAVSHYALTVSLKPEHEEAQERLTALKNSGKLAPVGELVETQEGETGKKSMMEVKK